MIDWELLTLLDDDEHGDEAARYERAQLRRELLTPLTAMELAALVVGWVIWVSYRATADCVARLGVSVWRAIAALSVTPSRRHREAEATAIGSSPLAGDAAVERD